MLTKSLPALLSGWVLPGFRVAYLKKISPDGERHAILSRKIRTSGSVIELIDVARENQAEI
jgi:hypothetical protein